MQIATDNANRFFSVVIPNGNTSDITESKTFTETKTINKWGFYINYGIKFTDYKIKIYITKEE